MALLIRVLLAAGIAIHCGAVVAGEMRAPQIPVDIKAQPMPLALSALAQQSGIQFVFPSEEVPENLMAREVVGDFTPRAALAQLLQDTGLSYRYINPRTVSIRTAAAAADVTSPSVSQRATEPVNTTRAGPAPGASTAGAAAGNGSARRVRDERTLSPVGVPEVLVKGSRVLSSDIRRTEDDAQPYVVFAAEEIRESQANNVEEFLRTRLPMNAVQGTKSQGAFVSTAGNRSQFDLRGLGASQTLILVDGRRLPGTYGRDPTGNIAFNQPDINGLPIAAIERIEVLPTTASGIYGGGATGGVVNVILKRDYDGFDVRATYGNTLDTDATHRDIEASAGFAFEDGRTRLTFNGSFSDSNPLLVGDRNFVERARALQLANNPGQFWASTLFVPIGYTTNITSINGSNLVLDNGTPLNSPRTSVPVGYGGTTTDNGLALRANAGQYNLDLPQDLSGAQQALMAVPKTASASAAVRREFTDNIEAFVDVAWLRNRSETFSTADATASVALAANAANNPFTTNIRISIPKPGLAFPTLIEDKTLRTTAGVIVHLPRSWNAGVDYVWNRVRTETSGTSTAFAVAANAAFSNGPLNAMRDVNDFPLDYSPYLLSTPNRIDGPIEITLDALNLRVSGPLFSLPGGPVAISALAEFRTEEARDSFIDTVNTTTRAAQTFFVPGRSQEVDSYYLEARMPLVSRDNAIPMVRLFELQAAVRHDAYTTRSAPSSVIVASRDAARPQLTYASNEIDASKVTAGLRWSPINDLTLRASFGSGFLPASIAQIVANPPEPGGFLNSFLTDPKRGGTAPAATSIAVRGGNPLLLVEDSESVSAGLVLTSRFVPDLRVSIDFTRIAKTGEISNLSDQEVIDLEDFLPGRILRGARLAGDPVGWAGPITQIDSTSANIAETKLRATDFQVDYTRQTGGFGEWHVYAVATRTTSFERRITPASALLHYAGRRDGPLEWRGNLGLNWNQGPWSMGWNMQYYDSYLVYGATALQLEQDIAILSQGSETVPSQTYHDVFARYRFDDAPRFASTILRGTEVAFGLQNVFDESPPIIAVTSSSGGYSTYGDPRLRRFSLSVKKSF